MRAEFLRTWGPGFDQEGAGGWGGGATGGAAQSVHMELQRESPTYILNEDKQPVMRAIGVSHTACKDEFRQHFRSHS